MLNLYFSFQLHDKYIYTITILKLRCQLLNLSNYFSNTMSIRPLLFIPPWAREFAALRWTSVMNESALLTYTSIGVPGWRHSIARMTTPSPVRAASSHKFAFQLPHIIRTSQYCIPLIPAYVIHVPKLLSTFSSSCRIYSVKTAK